MEHSKCVNFLEAACDFQHDLNEFTLCELATAYLIEERDSAEFQQQAAYFSTLTFCYFGLDESNGAQGSAITQLGLNVLHFTSILASFWYMRESSLFCNLISLSAQMQSPLALHFHTSPQAPSANFACLMTENSSSCTKSSSLDAEDKQPHIIKIISQSKISFPLPILLLLLLMSCFAAFDAMCKRIVSPTRHQNLDQKDMLQRKFRRRPPHYQLFTVINQDHERLSCIIFPNNFETLPTVLYLHGNGGHKMEAAQLISPTINLVAFDFAGCGKSQGQYLTYGQKEARDIGSVVDYVRDRFKVKKVALWGRSMGASLAMMYTSLHPRHIFCLILDTPFRRLKEVVLNVAEHNNKSIPGFLMSLVLYFVESKVQQLVGLDIFETDFMMHLNLLDLPILFLYSTQDVVVREENVRALFESYKGQKQLLKIDSLHHQDRSREALDEAMNFLMFEDGNRSTRTSMTSESKRGISISIRGSHRNLGI